MMGLALKNVTLTLFEDGKAIFDEQGEMLFTHFGISGPLTLSASSHLGDMKSTSITRRSTSSPPSAKSSSTTASPGLCPAGQPCGPGRAGQAAAFQHAAGHGGTVGIDPATKANQITREQKRELVQLIKHWRVSIDARATGPCSHHLRRRIGAGGGPQDHAEQKALGLYFAGEVLDVDAYTGGYNLQIAFCTAQAFANNL